MAHAFGILPTVGSLTPSKTLNSILGKAFWDVALAALSVRKEVVEGNFGLVERALTALGEGTEEGKELAERLILIGEFFLLLALSQRRGCSFLTFYICSLRQLRKKNLQWLCSCLDRWVRRMLMYELLSGITHLVIADCIVGTYRNHF